MEPSFPPHFTGRNDWPRTWMSFGHIGRLRCSVDSEPTYSFDLEDALDLHQNP